MQSSLIGKIEKAKRYAEEPDRITVSQLKVAFRGGHNIHDVGLDNGKWSCSCSFFATWNTCSHTMALERILGVMIPQTGAVPAEGS